MSAKIVGMGTAVAVASLLNACALEQSEIAIGQDSENLRAGQMCGGIAAFQCPEGQKCLIKENYPDASGTCVGGSQAKSWNDKCATVLCFAVECPSGFRRHFDPGHCCGRCVPDNGGSTVAPEGQCQSPADCNDLVHIMCVGSWSCNAGTCEYNCDGGVL